MEAAGKTMKSVLISCSARLAPFDIPEVSELLSDDEVDIYSIGTEKTAFFMITSDNTSTYDFLGAMIFSLMFTKMFEQACKEIAEQIGKATVRNTAVTESKGSSGSYSEADQILGRYLIDPAEIGRLERDECLVLITGLPPLCSKKYDVTKHPRWGEISG